MNSSSASAARSPRWFARLTQPVIGELSWRPPGWLSGILRRPWLTCFVVLLLTLGAGGGGWLWKWYAHRPQPPSVSWIVNLDEQPAPEDESQTQNMSLKFDRSVARLDLIDKDVSKMVTLTPPMKGKWKWQSGDTILFETDAIWPAATAFRIKLAPELFSRQVRIESLTRDYHTPPFNAVISVPLFYVNPKDPSVKQVTATLAFTHPVDHASLEKSLSLVTESGPSVFKPGAETSFTYDKHDRVVYIRSANVTVPQETAFTSLTVPTSVRTTAGCAGLAGEERAEVQIPASDSLFRVSSAQVMIVNTPTGEPEQVLLVSTSVGVKPATMTKAIHAWVLPKKRHPKGDDETDVWDSPGEVTKDVLAKSMPVELTMNPSDQEYAAQHSFKLNVREGAYVYVQVDKGTESVGGFTLGENFTSVSLVPDFPRAVHIMYDGSILALNGDRKLSILSRGVEQIEYRLERVTPSSINHLVSQSEGAFQSPVFNDYHFDESNITEQLIRKHSVLNMSTAKNNYDALDLSEFVDGHADNHGKLGLFILRILGRKGGANGDYYTAGSSTVPDPKTHPPDPNNINWRTGEPYDPTESEAVLADRRLILVTDLGLIVKDNSDGTHDVFVQSIKSGQPAGGIDVSVLGKNGIPVVSSKTDDTGHVAIPSLTGFTRERRPVAYVARRDDDVSFLPFGREDRVLNLSRFDISGVTGLAAHDLTAFLFTDRGIYRPGDTAKLGLIVKQRDWQGKLEGVPLRLDIIDPRGTVIQSRVLKLNAEGFLENEFVTRETSATGQYQVNCYFVRGGDNDTLLGSCGLKVSEFLPDRMKISAKLSTTGEGWVKATDLKGLVSLQNLYGAPAARHRVTGKVLLDPSQFGFERYPDYTFCDPYLNPHASRHFSGQSLPDQTTDDNGATTFDLNLAQLEPSAYRVSFLAEGFEKEGGRSVSAGAEVLVSPREWIVGVKPDGDFSYVAQHAQRVAHLLAVDSHLKAVEALHLTMKVVECRYMSILTQKPNGNYAYESVLKEEPVAEQQVAIAEKGLDWPLLTDQPGSFVGRLTDDHGDLVARVDYTVAGAGNVTRSLEKNAELTAKLSKPEYAPGEEIEVEITAPYTGAGLLTIERDKVYAHAWFQAKTTGSVQKIGLPEGFEGNGYLGIAFVRGLDSHEIYMSPLSYTVLPFKVNQEARHTRMHIDVPKLALPGQDLPIKVSASRPTRAVVYAIDEGILQVARYTLPDPLDYFFRKQALEVGTRQTVDLILPEYSIMRQVAAAGGDADEDAIAHHLNPFKRKHDAPVAYWSGIVDIGPDAKTFTYHVPDYFAGTVRVMVVANTADAVGSEEAKALVHGPFVISPNVPTFVAPGDAFDVSVAIANNVEGSGANASVKIDLQASDGLEVTQRPASDAVIPEGRDASFHWLLRAKDELGNADITVTTTLGDKKTSLASHLSIRPPVPYLTSLESGYFRGSEKRVAVSRNLYPQYRKASALLSPLPQGLVRGLGDYLEVYPYYCTEQIVSKAFPTLVSGETMEQGLSRAEIGKRISDILDLAATRQNDEGAFGLWMPQPDLHFDLPSVHIAHFMTEAKEQGYDVPDDLFKSALNHLRKDADGSPVDFRDARNQAYAIYILARNGEVMTNALEHNRRWFEQNDKDHFEDDIAAVYEAATYALLKNQSQADVLIKSFHLQNPKHRWPVEEIDYNDDLGRAAQYIYLLSLHFPERLKTLGPDDLTSLAFPIISFDYNTVSSAEAILALDAYARALKQPFLSGGCEIDEIVDGKNRKLDLSGGVYAKAAIDSGATELVFRNTGGSSLPHGLFFQVVQKGFDRDVVTKLMEEGIEVSREYRNKSGQAVTSAVMGEELTVVTHLRSTKEQEIQNIAVEDLLPGGFEIVDDSVHTGSCANWGQMDYCEVREDRLLAFGLITGSVTDITYRIKATNRGMYAIPPVQAAAMYHQKIRARGVSGTITVN